MVCKIGVDVGFGGTTWVLITIAPCTISSIFAAMTFFFFFFFYFPAVG